MCGCLFWSGRASSQVRRSKSISDLHTGDFVTPLSSQHRDAHDVAMYV